MEMSFYALCVMAVAAQITPFLFLVLKIVCLIIFILLQFHQPLTKKQLIVP